MRCIKVSATTYRRCETVNPNKTDIPSHREGGGDSSVKLGGKGNVRQVLKLQYGVAPIHHMLN